MKKTNYVLIIAFFISLSFINFYSAVNPDDQRFSYNYYDGSNKLKEVLYNEQLEKNFSYDSRGNLVSINGIIRYEYNFDNELTKVYSETGELLYTNVYDYQGRRVKKIDSTFNLLGGITYYIYQGNQVVYERYLSYGQGEEEPERITKENETINDTPAIPKQKKEKPQIDAKKEIEKPGATPQEVPEVEQPVPEEEIPKESEAWIGW